MTVKTTESSIRYESDDRGKLRLPLVLVIEDDPVTRFLLKEVLGKDYDVREAVDGDEGLAMALQLLPDLILSDVQMPGMDGFHLLKQIRSQPKLTNTPLLLLSALTDTSSRVMALQQQADDFLVKPFNPVEILARVKNLVEKHRLHRALKQRLDELENDMQLARRLQQSLLPAEIPNIPGFSFGTLYRPMDAIGGDFYEIIFQNDKLFLFLCDVSGHGIAAAFIAGMVKVTILNIIRDTMDPQEVLTRLDSSIRGNIGGHFVSAFCATIDIAERRMVYSSAGHPPAVLLRDQKSQALRIAGTLAGVFPNPVFVQESLDLLPGDRLFIYTDGIIEAENLEGQNYGEERLLTFLKESSQAAPGTVLYELYSSLQDYAVHRRFRDDITAVMLEFSGN